MRAYDIRWDTDGDKNVFNELPQEIDIPNGMLDLDEISDYLSDQTGFCHDGFKLSANIYLVDVCVYDDNNVPETIDGFYILSETKPTEIEIKAMPEWDEIKEKLSCEGIAGIELEVEPEDGYMVVNRELGSFTVDDISFERCNISLVAQHESDLEVYCSDDMWDDNEGLHAIKIKDRVVGFIEYNEDDSMKNTLHISQIEIFDSLCNLGIGKAAVKALVRENPNAKTITGLAVFTSVYFWHNIGVTFIPGGEFTADDALKWAKDDDEDLYEKYRESALAFTLDVNKAVCI